MQEKEYILSFAKVGEGARVGTSFSRTTIRAFWNGGQPKQILCGKGVDLCVWTHCASQVLDARQT